MNRRSFFRSTNLLRWTFSLLLMPAATASAIDTNRVGLKHLPAWTNTAGDWRLLWQRTEPSFHQVEAAGSAADRYATCANRPELIHFSHEM